MTYIYEATVRYTIDDVESFEEAESIFKACVANDPAIDGVTLVSISKAESWEKSPLGKAHYTRDWVWG